MTKRNFLLLILSVLTASALMFFLYPGMRSADGKCKLCGEEIHQGMSFTVTLTDGGKMTTCCPTCGLHLQVHNPEKIASAFATDYAAGRSIEAALAYYVEGSDVHHCDPQRMMRNETGGIYTMDWHRCDPSLVAFGSREAAAVFQAQHGGRVLGLNEAKATLEAH